MDKNTTRKYATRVPVAPPKSLLSETKERLRLFDFKAKKSLGQHFLVNSGVLRRILAAAEIEKSDLVIEVGPGLGILTRELAKVAGWVIAVELDNRLAQFLSEDLKPAGNVTVINRDILEAKPGALLKEVFPSLPSAVDTLRYKVVANLPYYITSAVIRHFLTPREKPALMVVMVQKEVARQITALPGKMSLLSVSVQLYGKPQVIDYVPAGSFYPAPEVDSAILKIKPYPNPVTTPQDEDSFFAVARAGFSAARKQLGNSIARGLKIPKEEAVKILRMTGIEPRRRAETLTIEEWQRLFEAFEKEKQNARNPGTSQDKPHTGGPGET